MGIQEILQNWAEDTPIGLEIRRLMGEGVGEVSTEFDPGLAFEAGSLGLATKPAVVTIKFTKPMLRVAAEKVAKKTGANVDELIKLGEKLIGKDVTKVMEESIGKMNKPFYKKLNAWVIGGVVGTGVSIGLSALGVDGMLNWLVSDNTATISLMASRDIMKQVEKGELDPTEALSMFAKQDEVMSLAQIKVNNIGDNPFFKANQESWQGNFDLVTQEIDRIKERMGILKEKYEARKEAGIGGPILNEAGQLFGTTVNGQREKGAISKEQLMGLSEANADKESQFNKNNATGFTPRKGKGQSPAPKVAQFEKPDRTNKKFAGII